jgi:type II secretion system protein E
LISISQELLHRGLVTKDALSDASALQRKEGLRLDHALVQLGHVTERQMLEVVGEQLSLDVVDLETVEIEQSTLDLLPSKLVHRKRLVPLSRANGKLRVVTSDAYDLSALDEIYLLTGLTVEPVLAPEEDINKVIKTRYGLGGDTIDEMVEGNELRLPAGVEDNVDLLEMAQEASVIKLVNEIIVEAIHERASDIHIEPYERELSIRYRIDGVLQKASLPSQIHRFQAAIISRLKILADLNIAEKRLPQDGRIKFQVGGRGIDVRVSVIPMLFGEGIVMRILDQAIVLYMLTDLGMDDASFRVFHSLIQRPHGILLVTGPTGSGKTTTLYAALNAIVGPEKKVLTVEDPVEYHLAGVNQIPVDPKVGMTFERGLRAILRHDPDVVMIGEIRDLETADAAIQAALTGHLVLSTLHTNDSASSATRLIDMGVEPFLVSSTLAGAMAQRLVRSNCAACVEDYKPKPETLPADFAWAGDTPLRHGIGCRECRGTGYRGRTGIYELMTMTPAVAQGIMDRVPSNVLVDAAKEGGLRLLREDGWTKVLGGVTTPDEVLRCTAE